MAEPLLREQLQSVRAEMRATQGIPDQWLMVLADVQDALAQTHDRVTDALRALSYTEIEAAWAMVSSLPDDAGGLVVSSKVADRAGITRSVIVSTLRKFESAGVMQCRSLGMKGTHIKLMKGLTARTLLDQIERFDPKRVA